MKKIIALLMCCCIFLTGCADFIESEKQRIGKEIEWIGEKLAELEEVLVQRTREEPPESSTADLAPKVPLSRSIYDTDSDTLYNPYCDFGIMLPYNWVVMSDEVYVDSYGYAQNGIVETDESIIKGDVQALEKLYYVPDYIIYENDTFFDNNIEVYIHNIAADENMAGTDLSHDDQYALINLNWFKNLGYTDVATRDDMYIGQQRYKVIFGRSANPDDHYRVILSRIIEEGYILNIDYISYSPDINDMYNLSDYIFNSETQPQLVDAIINRKTADTADANISGLESETDYPDYPEEQTDRNLAQDTENLSAENTEKTDETPQKMSRIREAVSKLDDIVVWFINISIFIVIMVFSHFITGKIYKPKPEDFEGMGPKETNDVTAALPMVIGGIILLTLIILSYG